MIGWFRPGVHSTDDGSADGSADGSMGDFVDASVDALNMDVINLGETHDEINYHVDMYVPGEESMYSDDGSDFVTADEADSQILEDGLMFGDNGRVQLITSGDACVDLFGTWVPSSNTESVEEKLKLAWDENNILTLKTIFHKGNTRDGGCGDSLNFIRAYLWLFKHHPKTALENVKHVAKNSSLQTLLLITKFILYDPEQELADTMFASTQLSPHIVDWHLKNSQLETHKISTDMGFLRQKGSDYHSAHSQRFKRTCQSKKKAGNFRKYRQARHILHVREFVATKYPGRVLQDIYKVREGNAVMGDQGNPKVLYEWVDEATKLEWSEFVKNKNIIAKEAAKKIRTDRVKATRQGLLQFFLTHMDSNTTNLVIAVRDIFVDGLLTELIEMLEQHPDSKARNGLYHKWAPTRGGSMDKATNLGYMIQQELNRRISTISGLSSVPIQDRITCLIPHIVNMTSRMKYERILRMMRNRSAIPESFVGAKQFHEVDYLRMPGKCLSVHGTNVFKKNDTDRFVAHFKSTSDKLDEALKSGDTHAVKAAAKAVKVDSTETHTILRHAMDAYRLVTATLHGDGGVNTQINEAESNSDVWKLQFINLLSQLMSNKKNGSSWIPVVDTSGSMSCVDDNILAKPIDVAITLGLLVSMANDPLSKWFCRMVTFNQRPDIYHILHGVEGKDEEMDDGASETGTSESGGHPGNELETKLDAAMAHGVKDMTGIMDLLNTDTFMLGKIVSGVRGMPWGGNTDLVAVFRKQLAPLVEAQLKHHDDETLIRDRIANENMIIFTDMQFDESDGIGSGRVRNSEKPVVSKHGLLMMEEITHMFKECGIDKVPKIVFWNLNAVVGAPSGAGVPGVTMVTGYSAGMLKFFLDDNLDGYDPVEYITLQLENEAYHDLKVCD